MALTWVSHRALGWDEAAQCWNWRKARCRFRRGFPAAFAILASLVFLGGVLYPPTNHTAITYRIPRVLHWLAHEQWLWVHTPDYRINNRACGIEWLSAPLLLFTRSDRTLFLLNFIPFLLLPGLIYSLFTRLGVGPRVAWHWMWLLPTGYSFLLQAGSAGNDTFPTVYALAAIDFAFRARTSRRGSDLVFSLLAAALLTGAKASNLPLLLPWALLLLPWRLPSAGGAGTVSSATPLFSAIRKKPMVSLVVLMVAGLVSFLPTAILNYHYCGDWSGLKLERPGMDMKNPLVGLWGNAFIFLLDNFVPPFFPLANWWNQSALAVLPQTIVRPLAANFEQGWHFLWELPGEDWVGLGFGLSVLAAVSLLASGWAGGAARGAADPGGRPTSSADDFPPRPPVFLQRLVVWSSWAALLAYCVKSGMVTGARLISPYYPLLLPWLLRGVRQAWLVRQRWWRALAWAVFGLAFPVLILTPARPLWPAQTVLKTILSFKPDQHLAARGLQVYSVYAVRSDPLAQVRQLLPPDLKIVGFMADPDDPDLSFWRPFGSRRVEHIFPNESGTQIRGRQITYAVVGGHNLVNSGVSLTNWLEQSGAKMVAATNAVIKVSEGPQPWYVVKFGP